MRMVKELVAAMAFGFMAAKFVIQPETWPVFERWCETRGDKEPLALTLAEAEELTGRLAIGMLSADAAEGGLN